MKLFIDDLRSLDMIYPNQNPQEWVIVRSYHEFVNYITKFGLPTFISFDHDLGFEHTRWYFENGGHDNPPDPSGDDFREKTGYDCTKWLVDFCIENKKPLPNWQVHSANPVGASNIRNYLNNAKKYVNF